MNQAVAVSSGLVRAEIPKYTAEQFGRELQGLLNKYNIDTITATPDFVLSAMMFEGLAAYARARARTMAWHFGGGL